MAMREERGYQTYPDTVGATAQAPSIENVGEEVPTEQIHSDFERTWDGVRWVEPNVATHDDEAEPEVEERSIYQGLYSTRIRCGDCRTSNFRVEPERTFHGSRLEGNWIAYSMLLCPTCGNGKPRLITGDKNDIGYWLLGLKKIE